MSPFSPLVGEGPEGSSEDAGEADLSATTAFFLGLPLLIKNYFHIGNHRNSYLFLVVGLALGGAEVLVFCLSSILFLSIAASAVLDALGGIC